MTEDKIKFCVKKYKNKLPCSFSVGNTFFTQLPKGTIQA